MVQLRDYQQTAVDATLNHFRKSDDPAVIVLPTGSGKSLVIAELARLANHPILVLAHVKELVAQNAAKYEALGLKAGVFSAGLGLKESQHQVTFASIQSIVRNLHQFQRYYSLVIIDECHRVNDDKETQYQQLLKHLRLQNSQLKVLGLTATPFRLGSGWIYQFDYRGFIRSNESRLFKYGIYELPLSQLIRQGYLTPPKIYDAPIAEYQFESCHGSDGRYHEADMNRLVAKHPRVTQSILEQVVSLAQKRQGVMIFAATVKHAQEIINYLPEQQARLIIGDTHTKERDAIIDGFKSRQFKFLVNVAVLTTGFDAPHVDFIAILRPTESISLYQQIVGRGLRLSDGKDDCLVIDYAGNGYDLYHPEIGSPKPHPNSELVQVFCPGCGFANTFWGLNDAEGKLLEHYGRRCQGVLGEPPTQAQCDYRFRYKECPSCMGENDIAARTCSHCHHTLIDPDDQLKRALALKDAKVIRCSGMTWLAIETKLEITYYDEDGSELKERFDLNSAGAKARFNQLYAKRQWQVTPPPQSAQQAQEQQQNYRAPSFVIARKRKKYWQIAERIFDYQGQYRLANHL